jgi:hypothetical protein
MARIEHIRFRLENWALWHSRKQDNAQGYRTENILSRWGIPTSGYREATLPVIDEDARAVDGAVKSLQLTRSHLYLVLMLTYAHGLPRHLVARRMARAESTVSRNLEDADRALDEFFRAAAARRQGSSAT